MAKKIVVVMGGFSSEREVSLISGKGVVEALKVQGMQVLAHDLKNVDEFIAFLRAEKPDVVFNALHGTFGEDGTIQRLLDALQIPYTHSGLASSAIGMNKSLTKKIVKQAGVKVAEEQKMSAKDFLANASSFEMPFVVKPIADGSSVGVFIVKNNDDLKKISYPDLNIEVMVEKFIEGCELTVMCLEGKSYVVTELKTKEMFYDYKAKYTSGMTEHVLPAEIPLEATKKCLEYAITAHNALGCSTISRSDFRYNPKDDVVFLEINTNPGLTPLSLAPEQAKYAGISYEKLCVILVENASCHKI